jgi:2-polyprenyl-3-methyl-5-hydroxy-6-metoxy-1,4-benzoquinol methylase
VQPKSQAEFDAYSNRYDAAVNAATAFSGLTVDFFTKVKANYILQIISEHFEDAAKVSALDLGCGVGNTLSLLSGKVGRLAGVDVSEACVSTARGRMPETEYRTFNGLDLPYADMSFDVVFAICVFHHVPIADRLHLASDVRRLLRAGGMFMIFEHNPRNLITMRVVNSCEFDKNAALLRSADAESLMRGVGLERVSSRFILTIPAAGPFLLGVDRMFSRLPLGAQYYTLGYT